MCIERVLDLMIELRIIKIDIILINYSLSYEITGGCGAFRFIRSHAAFLYASRLYILSPSFLRRVRIFPYSEIVSFETFLARDA